MLIKIYEIEMKTSSANPTMETFRKRVDAEKGYLRRMTTSEAPVTCNYFFKADRLHLLAFYGFLDYYDGLDLDRLFKDVKMER